MMLFFLALNIFNESLISASKQLYHTNSLSVSTSYKYGNERNTPHFSQPHLLQWGLQGKGTVSYVRAELG